MTKWHRHCPQVDRPEGVVIGTLEAHGDASSPAVHASRGALRRATQGSLLAGPATTLPRETRRSCSHSVVHGSGGSGCGFGD